MVKGTLLLFCIVFTSTSTWVNQKSHTKTDLLGIAYGKGIFVAIGYRDTIVTSPDGINWSTAPSGLLNDTHSGYVVMRSIVFGNDKFVAAGRLLSSTYIFTSNDGVNWDSTRLSGCDELFSISYGNNRFVAVGRYGSIASSDDGTQWTTFQTGYKMKKGYADLKTIHFADGMFIAGGESGSIISSLNGSEWAVVDAYFLYDVNAIGYCNGTYVVSGPGGRMRISSDGINWAWPDSEAAIMPGNTKYNSMVFANQQLIAVSLAGDIAVSSNCSTWVSEFNPGKNTLWCICSGENRFVAVGDSGTIITKEITTRCTQKKSVNCNPVLRFTTSKHYFEFVNDFNSPAIFKLMTIQGRILINAFISSDTPNIKIDIRLLKKGIYIAQLQYGTTTAKEKVIIK